LFEDLRMTFHTEAGGHRSPVQHRWKPVEIERDGGGVKVIEGGSGLVAPAELPGQPDRGGVVPGEGPDGFDLAQQVGVGPSLRETQTDELPDE
jgi:hypothetical protein